MKAAAIDAGLVAQLRALAPGAKPHMGEIRRAIGCSQAELADSVQRLRYRGMILFDRIALAPSMLAETEVIETGGCAPPIVFVKQVTEAAFPDVAAVAGAPGGAVEAAPVSAAEARLPAAESSPPGDDGAGPGAPLPPGRQLLARIEAWSGGDRAAESRLGKLLFNHPGFVPLLRARGTVRDEARLMIELSLADYPAGFPEHIVIDRLLLRRRVQEMLGASDAGAPAGAGSAPASGEDGDDQSAAVASLHAAAEGAPAAEETVPPSPPAPASADAGAPKDRAEAVAAIAEAGTEVHDPRPIREQVEEEALEAGRQRGEARKISAAAASRLKAPRAGGLSLVESIQTQAAETPRDLMLAINRTHAETWTRVLMCARAMEVTPAQALYRALGEGLAVLEAEVGVEVPPRTIPFPGQKRRKRA